MCGIVGAFRVRPESSPPFDKSITAKMRDALSHRGPDGFGDYFSNDGNCWLAHRRLAIIDLKTGHQPMCTADERLWITYNGEIYNYVELRNELIAKGYSFRTNSDTEVILNGYLEWGNLVTTKLRGIFAFAIHDTAKNELFIARDHLGVKPIFYWFNGHTFLFSSEMKSILCHPDFKNKSISKSAVSQILVSRFVSRPGTIFEEIKRLPEASFATVGLLEKMEPKIQTYWDTRFSSTKSKETFQESLETLDSKLREIVDMQMMSDVPLGAQLSGGVDSSIVVALMDEAKKKHQSKEPILTFSVGFDIPQFSELNYAKMVADRYQTKHKEFHISFADFVSVLAKVNWYYDEPNSEPSSIPTYLMCKSAKEDVTVMLTGEGADEQFGGYNKYAFDLYSRFIDWMPSGTRQKSLQLLATALPFKARRLKSILEILSFSDPSKRFATWYGALDPKSQNAVLSKELRENYSDTFAKETYKSLIDHCSSKNRLEQFLYTDIHTRLADNLLVKGDRMSMGASVEARVPMIDHLLVEYAASLPTTMKVKGLKTKILLKKLAERYLPYETIYRRKVGFTVPFSSWACGPLAEFIKHFLLSEQCLERGYFDPDGVRNLVNKHISKEVDREQGLWVLLSLELWHRMFIDDDGSVNAADRLQNKINELVMVN